MNTTKQAILTTILYSDIFSFPLTKDELWKFLISDTKIPRKAFDSSLERLKNVVSQDGYYCLKGHEKDIFHRKKNLSEVSKKVEIAKNISKKLSIIPSILFIGISGGLAAGNAKADDDIDFVVITKKGTLFMTRLLILIVLELLGVRRRRTQKKTANTICLNLLFDETVISWFAANQDIYLAREIAQIVPLFERNNMYYTFFQENAWIRHFLPNVSFPKRDEIYQEKSKGGSEMIIFNTFTEAVVRFLQIKRMRSHQTREIIDSRVLAFHPNDYRTLTLEKLRLKMHQFGLLTKF